MTAPVIYDDGGSTRIKKFMTVGAGVMDALLDVQEGVPALNRAGSTQIVSAVGTNYSTIRISFMDSDGAPFQALAPTAFSTFEILSGNQKITGDLVVDGTSGLKNLRMVVHGPSENPPVVEAKQSKGKRRYIVSNAPPIDEVFVDGVSRYRSAAPGGGSSAPAIYTSVTVS
jgi:hypothetical protein